eukprot:Nitzschia sp. Nitz4//scaffold28_size193895//71689//73674//NITZ4_001649-RA/size193895-processed-gene-0.221-mRNA-1//1//CDS//3329545934//3142//frame0
MINKHIQSTQTHSTLGLSLDGTASDDTSYGTLLESAVVSVLRQDQHHNAGGTKCWSTLFADKNLEEARRWLGDYLIMSNNTWKEDTLVLLDEIWRQETSKRPTTRIATLGNHFDAFRIGNTQVQLWKGDVTALDGEALAIVNAANDQGLGCFQPNHKCIDNVIHRQAGPRLRMACKKAMKQRGHLLAAGTEPVVTDAFALPSSKVIHITGPQVRRPGYATQEESNMLAVTYENILTTAASNPQIRHVAIPCISTGLFGFPSDKAAHIALNTIGHWLSRNPDAKLESVILNVFTENDYQVYQHALTQNINPLDSTMYNSPCYDGKYMMRKEQLNLAKTWIDQADAVLICAGAGMSVKPGEMVYTNAADFARHYPWFPKWGYKTSYHVMALGGDQSVPETAKWALWASHMNNIRWKFTPNQGYTDLLGLIDKKDYFVLTSNVDACFERSGFDPERIYTPQGEWTYLQCMKPCRKDSVFESRPYLDMILPQISEDGFIPAELVPKCPRCQSSMFGNVRGGGWYLHHDRLERQNVALQKWMEAHIHSNVVIIEVGVGFNTPTVTRFPMESYARELGRKAHFIRINPSDPEVPEGISALALPEGWESLAAIQNSSVVSDASALEHKVRHQLYESDLMIPSQVFQQQKRSLRHFDWRRFLRQLRADD